MAFSPLSTFEVGDKQGEQSWLFEHYMEHKLFSVTLLSQTPPVRTVDYPIERMDDVQAWLVAHNEISQSVWTGLGGGQSVEFSRVDWNDPEQLNSWLDTHATWHQQVRDSLGL